MKDIANEALFGVGEGKSSENLTLSMPTQLAEPWAWPGALEPNLVACVGMFTGRRLRRQDWLTSSEYKMF